ncbi:energy transducer TonB [Flavitalea flava]
MMKSLAPLLTLILVSFIGRSQPTPNYFEGTLVYKVSVQPKRENLKEKDVRKMIMKGDLYTVTTRDGNSLETTGFMDAYTIQKDKKIYFKFRKLDTLYYMDFSADTSQVISHSKTDSSFSISGYPCKVLTIQTGSGSRRYYYTSSLRSNPDLSKDMTIDHWNLYNQETNGGIFLWSRLEYGYTFETDSCIKVEQKKVDDHLFDLPILPVKKFVASELLFQAHFPGKPSAWLTYLQNNLDSKFAFKYVKIARNQQEASQKVIVEFAVAEDGSISNLHITNKGEFNAHLEEEAMRVIRDSPRWVPANFFGEKLTAIMQQPVIFIVRRE